MAGAVLSVPCQIPANPDISGIGVRVAIYAQNLLCLLSALWALWDGKVTQGKLDYAETQTTTNLVLAFAILISSIAQAHTLGMTNYHGNIVLMMSWMNNTNAFVYFILYVHHKTGLPEGKGRIDVTWRAWMYHVKENFSFATKLRLHARNRQDTETREMVSEADSDQGTDISRRRIAGDLVKRFVLVLGSLHLTLMAVLGFLLWSKLEKFGLGNRDHEFIAKANQCAVETAKIAILGQDVRMGSPTLRKMSLIIYSILLIPGINLVFPMALFLGAYTIHYQWAFLALTGRRTEQQRRPSWQPLTEESRRSSSSSSSFPAKRWLQHLTNLVTTARSSEVLPAYVGLGILLAINLVFIVDIEVTLDHNRRMQSEDEADWGFGQILAILLLLLPLRDLLEAMLARRLKQRQGEIEEDLRDALAKEDFDGIKRAIDRGSTFPSPRSRDQHSKFWAIIAAQNALEYFNSIRRTRMTVAEKARESDLHLAIQRRDSTEIDALYEQGADLIAGVLESTDASSVILEYSLLWRQDHIAQFHIPRCGPQINDQVTPGQTPLFLAAEQGNEVVVRCLLEHPLVDINFKSASNARTALIAASGKGHEPIARMLLKKADIDLHAVDGYGKNALIWASQEGHEGVASALLEKDDIEVNTPDELGWTPLIWASHSGHKGIARRLLERPDIQPNATDKDGKTALMGAIQGGFEGISTMLLQRPDIQANAATRYGLTTLMFASQQGHEATARMLLDRTDVEVNATSKFGSTALMFAARLGHEGIARMLLARLDVDVNAADEDGETALMNATQWGHEAIADLLLERPDIDVHPASKNGKTAYLIALDNGLDTVAEKILESSPLTLSFSVPTEEPEDQLPPNKPASRSLYDPDELRHF